jgi:hypothetical protein
MHDLFMHGENIKMNDNDENDNYYDGDDNDNENDEIFHRSVRSILDQLVKHFRQNIHSDLEENSPSMIVPSNKSNDHDDDDGNDNNNNRVDDSSGTKSYGDNNELPRELSPIIRYWLDQLWSIAVQQQQQVGTTDTTTTNDNDNDNTAIEVVVLMVVSEWINGYDTSIRSIIFDTNGTNHHRTATANTILVPPFNPGCSSVLKNYELVLSEILFRLLDLVATHDDDDNNSDRNDDNNDNDNSNNNNNNNNITKSGSIVIKSSPSSLIATSSSSSSSSSSSAASPAASSLKRSLSRTINIISTDVTILTAAKNNEDNEDDNNNNNNNNDDNKNKNLRRNVALPTLLKILSDTLTTLDQVCVLLDNNKDTNNDENTSISNDNNGVKTNSLLEYYDCFRRCAVTLLAFDDGSNNNNNNNNNNNEKDDNSATSSLNIISPHHLSPSLSLPISTSTSLMTPASSVNVNKNDNLDIVQRMIKRLQDCRGDSSSKSDDDDNDDDNDDDLCPSYSYLDDNYWDSYSKSYLSTQGWIDPNNTKYISQLVDDIWNKMLSLLLLNRRQVEEVRQSKLLQRKSVLKILGGASPLLRDVRAHFFGRDMHGVEELLTQQQEEETISASSVVIRMGRRVVNNTTKKHTSRSNSNDDPPYQMIPSRIAVAVNALRLLLTPDMILLEHNDYQDDVVDVSSYGYRITREKILEDVFPICASLVDSTNTTYSTLGAAGFLLVTDVLLQSQLKDTTIHDVVDDDRRKILKCNNNDGNNNNNNALLNFMENTLSVLERAFQSSEGHGPVVVTIGRAQSKLFEIMLRQKEKNEDCHDDDRVRRRRRTVTGHWLTRLEKSSYRPTSEEQCLELLLGGILPLLSQHAVDRNNEADAIEVGRMGLAALLPLTTMTTTDGMGELWGDETTRKTQMASMVALINLMFAAHLIMPCHGGKIMSNLLAAAATATPITNGNKNGGWSEEKSPKTPTAASIRSMAVLTAAIALNICGPKFAGELVQSIEEDHEQYQQNILTVVSEVCKLAGDLIVREQI